MPDSVCWGHIELIGTSNDSWEKAAANVRSGKLQNLSGIFALLRSSNSTSNWMRREKPEAYRAKLNVSFKFEEFVSLSTLAPACGGGG